MNIKELSKLAGVSSATVSRVLNNSDLVSEKMRNKVLEVIRENNYVPSAIARSLSNNDTSCIGVIIPDIANDFFSKVIDGINEVAEEYKHNIMFMGTNETIEKEHKFLNTVESQRLKGLIITPVSSDDGITREYLARLESRNIPVVLVDRDIKGLELDGVFVDNFSGAFDGVTELIKAGHKDIGIITGPETSKPGRDRLKGYLKAMEENGLRVKEEYIQCGDFKIDMAYRSMERLMTAKNPVSAVFSSNNLTTMGCLKYMTEHHLKLGKDVALLGFDDIEALKAIDYKISVIDRDATEQGRVAMRIMGSYFDKEKEPEKGKSIIHIPYQVILRGSEVYHG